MLSVHLGWSEIGKGPIQPRPCGALYPGGGPGGLLGPGGYGGVRGLGGVLGSGGFSSLLFLSLSVLLLGERLSPLEDLLLTALLRGSLLLSADSLLSRRRLLERLLLLSLSPLEDLAFALCLDLLLLE